MIWFLYQQNDYEKITILLNVHKQYNKTLHSHIINVLKHHLPGIIQPCQVTWYVSWWTLMLLAPAARLAISRYPCLELSWHLTSRDLLLQRTSQARLNQYLQTSAYLPAQRIMISPLKFITCLGIDASHETAKLFCLYWLSKRLSGVPV